MHTLLSQKSQTEWVKILKNGLITIPKNMREKAGIKDGDVAKATFIGNKIIIEPREEVEYRTFTDDEIAQWLEDDKLPPEKAKEVEEFWKEQGLP